MIEKYIRKIDSIDLSGLFKEYLLYESKIQWTVYNENGSKQAGVQYAQDEDPWSCSVGRSKGIDQDCTLLNPFFKNTILEGLVNKYNLKRTRLMWVGEFSCYTMHEDPSPRIHIPLITNKNCYFVFKDYPPFYLEPGYIWYVDTTLPHTFMNCSSMKRLHIVGAV